MTIVLILTFALQITCALHAAKHSKPTTWIIVIVMLPVLGSVAYFLFEILPELRHNRAARKMGSDLGEIVSPDRDSRSAVRDLNRTDSIDNRRAAARECLQKGMTQEAIVLYERCLEGVCEHDPTILLGLAEAHYQNNDFTAACGVLERLKEHNPDFSSDRGHLLYAMSLEALGKDDDAIFEYAAVVSYAKGEEARYRYALFLGKRGDKIGAAREFQTVIGNVDKSSKHYFREQRSWYDLARQGLEDDTVE